VEPRQLCSRLLHKFRARQRIRQCPHVFQVAGRKALHVRKSCPQISPADQSPVHPSLAATVAHECHSQPELAVRELAANALVHQDFGLGGAGPMGTSFRIALPMTSLDGSKALM
jgi:hypothetical protein